MLRIWWFDWSLFNLKCSEKYFFEEFSRKKKFSFQNNCSFADFEKCNKSEWRKKIIEFCLWQVITLNHYVSMYSNFSSNNDFCFHKHARNEELVIYFCRIFLEAHISKLIVQRLTMLKIPHIQSLSRQNLVNTLKTSLITIFCVNFLKNNTVEEDLNIQNTK